MSMLSACGRAARRFFGSWRNHPLVTGVMLGLTLTWGITPLLNPASVAVAAPKEEARGGLIDLGIDDLIAAHKSAWETLFQTGWSADHWTYPLEKEITDLGEYQGVNDFGEPFTLTVLSWGPVDMGAIELPPDQKQWAIDHEYRSGSVVGWLSTDLGSVAVLGTAVRLVNNGVEDSRFLFDYFADPESPIFTDGARYQGIIERAEKDYEQIRSAAEAEALRITIEAEARLFETLDRLDSLQYAQQQGADPACIAACYAAYNNAVAQAVAAYQAAVQAAQATRDAAIQAAADTRAAAIAAANATYNAAKTAADNTLAACGAAAIAAQMACRIAGLACGLFVLACQLACSAIFAAAMTACIVTHQNAVNAAQAALTAAINAANAAYNASVNAANAAYDAAVQQASLALNNAMNAAEAALRACLAACGAPPPPIVRQHKAGIVIE